MSSSRLPPAGGGGRLPTSGAGGGGRIPLVSPLVGRGRTASSGGQQVPGAPQDAQNNADPLGNNNHPNGAPNNNGAGAVNVEANGNEQAAALDAPAQNIDADTGPPQNNNAGGRQGAQPPAAVNGAVNNDADGEEFLSVNECPICTLPAYPPTALGEQSMQAICIPCLAQWAHTSNRGCHIRYPPLLLHHHPLDDAGDLDEMTWFIILFMLCHVVNKRVASCKCLLKSDIHAIFDRFLGAP